MTSKKAGNRLGRAIVRSNGRETRQVRRARWAAQGHDRKMWHGIPYRGRVISYKQWNQENDVQRELNREIRHNNVLSMIASASAMLSRPFIRRHQSR